MLLLEKNTHIRLTMLVRVVICLFWGWGRYRGYLLLLVVLVGDGVC